MFAAPPLIPHRTPKGRVIGTSDTLLLRLAGAQQVLAPVKYGRSSMGGTPATHTAAAGHDAQHVAHVGKAGWKDWNVLRYARDGDFVLVTNDASDFRRLYAAQPLHAGLIILIPALSRLLQRKLFRAALDELAVIGEPVNRVLEVDLDGDDVTLALYDLPSGGA